MTFILIVSNVDKIKNSGDFSCQQWHGLYIELILISYLSYKPGKVLCTMSNGAAIFSKEFTNIAFVYFLKMMNTHLNMIWV